MCKKIINKISRKWYFSISERAEIAEGLYKRASVRLAECQVLLDSKESECVALIKANGQLKRDLDIEIRQKEELSGILDRTIRMHVCQEDCVRRYNKGPGASACRNCTRNPNAVDKYMKEDY